MQQAIPYKSWAQSPLYSNNPLTHSSLSLNSSILTTKLVEESTNLRNMVSENAVIVFAKRGCCMSHVVKRLLLGLGVNPAVYEVDEEDEAGVLDELEMINKLGNGIDHQKVQFPAVFIGGKLYGGLDRIMAAHITGELIPVLKEAKALWL
ncbi:putative Glutaredoxin [Melia azedarach]|uniref:Glutaredoxin n=3 Tax=Melia azedarach TaxID=155640 RepID=A0ACC1Z376_MELAZ|nr:putative Glutaredoxin [Melia azedarach]KAJ4729727.1 putative Glutaredoxin [Melia azedarach]KAJ4729728.1 putative Glutaredoxin [Melia azedarach]